VTIQNVYLLFRLVEKNDELSCWYLFHIHNHLQLLFKKNRVFLKLQHHKPVRMYDVMSNSLRALEIDSVEIIWITKNHKVL